MSVGGVVAVSARTAQQLFVGTEDAVCLLVVWWLYQHGRPSSCLSALRMLCVCRWPCSEEEMQAGAIFM